MKQNTLFAISAFILVLACSEKTELIEGANPCDEITSSIYQESEGVLIIEVENGKLPDGWEVKNELGNYLGNAYVQWQGKDFMSKPGPGIIQFKARINNPGTYRIQIRNYIAVGTSNTEHNDVWLRMPDADDYYGEKKGHFVYPKGSGKSPTPKGSGSDGWFKIYNNTRDKWSWGSKTSDHDAHNIYAKFKKAGIYTIELSGRSMGFALDRLTLYKEEGITGTDETLVASEITCQ